MSTDPVDPANPVSALPPGSPARPPHGPEQPPAGEGGASVPVRIRPAVAAVLAAGALIAIGTLLLDPPPAWRYGLVGAIAVLYFLTKVRHWL